MQNIQTYIAIILDASGKEIDFERFSCKRVQTVQNNMIKLFNNSLYRALNKEADKIAIYATPDGYTQEAAPAMVFSI